MFDQTIFNSFLIAVQAHDIISVSPYNLIYRFNIISTANLQKKEKKLLNHVLVETAILLMRQFSGWSIVRR